MLLDGHSKIDTAKISEFHKICYLMTDLRKGFNFHTSKNLRFSTPISGNK